MAIRSRGLSRRRPGWRIRTSRPQGLGSTTFSSWEAIAASEAGRPPSAPSPPATWHFRDGRSFRFEAREEIDPWAGQPAADDPTRLHVVDDDGLALLGER